MSVALQDVTEHTVNSARRDTTPGPAVTLKSKPDRKPKPLSERRAAREGSHMPPVKRNIQRKSREFKLGVLCHWKHALVPDEDLEGARRHVTWQNIAVRYQLKKSTLFNWKNTEQTILHTEKNRRSLRNSGVGHNHVGILLL